ncbi:unnamed protein product [Trichobilharzia regenti]|nr:unnamed protein product [Trichobilharzia regenti]
MQLIDQNQSTLFQKNANKPLNVIRCKLSSVDDQPINEKLNKNWTMNRHDYFFSKKQFHIGYIYFSCLDKAIRRRNLSESCNVIPSTTHLEHSDHTRTCHRNVYEINQELRGEKIDYLVQVKMTY